MINTDAYINIPFKECDCFALVSKFLKEQRNIDIGFFMDTDFDKNWIKIPLVQIKAYDGILIKAPCTGSFHFGVYVKDGMFLHTMLGQSSHLGKIEVYKKRIIGVYRWRN